MADFLTAFTAMWNNEGEVWGREAWCELVLYKIKGKTLYALDSKPKEWNSTMISVAMLQATDWRKVDTTRKEVKWWEAWEWAHETKLDFWYQCEGEETMVLNFKDDWSDWSIARFLEEAQRNTRWFIPVDTSEGNGQ